MKTVLTIPRLLMLISAIVVFGFSCSDSNTRNCKISGKFTGEFEGTLYLKRMAERKLITFDSTKAIEGNFSFNEISLKSPEMLYIQPEGKDAYIQFFAENSDIYIDINPDTLQNTIISGSAAHYDFADFKENNKVFINKLNDLYRQINLAQHNSDTTLINELDSVKQLLLREQESFLFQFVIENDRSHTAAYIASEKLAHSAEHAVLQKLLDNFSLELAGTLYYNNLQERIKLKAALMPGEKVPYGNFLNELTITEYNYLWIIFPYPEHHYVEKTIASIRKIHPISTKLNMTSLVMLPVGSVPSGLSRQMPPRTELIFVDEHEYGNLQKHYEVNYAFKNFVIDKDSIILKSGKTLEETELFLNRLTEKQTQE